MINKDSEDNDKVRIYKISVEMFIGRKGGTTSMLIMECISIAPCNINEISKKIGLHYNTVKYHVDLLCENELLENDGKKYGRLYYFSQKLLENLDAYKQVLYKANFKAKIRNDSYDK